MDDATPSSHTDDTYIADRAIQTFNEDKLNHHDVVDELAHIVTTVEPPANIALYGPWGSGKSGIGNLLRNKLNQIDGLTFARLDAFKYAEEPLRRQILTTLAKEFGVKRREFESGLYSSRSETTFEFSIPKLVTILLTVFALVAIIVAAILLANAGISSSVSHKGFVSTLKGYAINNVPTALLAAALVSGLVTAVVQAISVKRDQQPPAGPDRFEALFRQLIKQLHATRVVIFVDELDRCAPSDVVSILDTIRTFLDVEPCVFVVAADKSALEGALAESIRQITTSGARDPYYTSASSYLDKVFHRTVTIPPPMSKRMTRYALDLISERKGMWESEHVERAEIVSVLIPSHVRTPRRIKALLNSYASAFRVAQSREKSGFLERSIKGRSLELAKLVCLQVEFPYFAQDLILAPDLASLVLQQTDKDKGERRPDESGRPDFQGHFPPGSPRPLSSEIHELAVLYAEGRLPLTAVLGPDMSMSKAPSKPDDAGSTIDGDRKDALHSQFLAYLRRTAGIPNPGLDLIYLESSGSVFGLPAEVADALEDAAVNGMLEQFHEKLLQLPTVVRQRALRLAEQTIRDALGQEGANAAEVVLRTIPELASEDYEPVADSLTAALRPYLLTIDRNARLPEGRGRIPPATEAELKVGALLLGLRCKSANGPSMIKVGLNANVYGNAKAAVAVVGVATELSRMLPDSYSRSALMGSAVKTALSHGGKIVIDALAELPTSAREQVLTDMKAEEIASFEKNCIADPDIGADFVLGYWAKTFDNALSADARDLTEWLLKIAIDIEYQPLAQQLLEQIQKHEDGVESTFDQRTLKALADVRRKKLTLPGSPWSAKVSRTPSRLRRSIKRLTYGKRRFIPTRRIKS